MPFVAAAGAVAWTAAAAGAVSYLTAAQYAIAAISLHYANRSAKRQAGEADRISRQGRGYNPRDTVGHRSLIVGRAAIGIERIVFRKTHGANREMVTFIACFGGHEIDAVEDILFNNESVGLMASRDSDGWYQDSSSKYVKTDTRGKAVGGEWPSTGGEIVLSGDVQSVVSVTVVPNDVAIDLTPGVHYKENVTVTSGGRSVRIEALPGSAAYVGMPCRVTYLVQDTRSLVRAKVYLGSEAGERDLYAEAIPLQNTDPQPGDPPEQVWTSAHLLKGQPRVSFTLVWDRDIFGATGFPEITFIVRGAKCYDFVSGQTNWTDNAARIAAWYLMRPEGFGASLSEIDTTLAIAAQNACDESVPYGEDGSKTQPRYRCDGVIDVTANPIDNLMDLLGAMAGDAVPVGPTWDLYAGVAQTPVYTLTDSDLAGGAEEFVQASGLNVRVNCVRGLYRNRESNYQDGDIVPYESSTYIAQDDGEKEWLDVVLPFTTDPWAAQRIARLRLHQARNAATWTATYNLGAYPVRAGQTIRCQHSEYGFDGLESGAGKRFSVMSRRMHHNGEIELAMMETAASIYSWNYDEGKEPDPTRNTIFPDPTYIEPLNLHPLVSDATTYDIGTNEEKIPYVLMSWDELPQEVAREQKLIQIEWKGSGELGFRTETLTADQTSIKLRPVWGGMLIAGAARVINALGVSSKPAFFEHRASMDLPGNKQAVSANLLTNATFKAGTKGWRLWKSAAQTDPVTFEKPFEAQRIAGTPTNALVRQAGTVSVSSQADTEPSRISVIPGRTYCAYAHVLTGNCTAAVHVWFGDENGNAITQVGGSIVGPMGPSTAMTRNIDAYRVTELFVSAPSNARQAIFIVLKSGTTLSSASALWFCKPFFGEVPSGSTQRPPWDPGGLPTIDTSGLERGAATDIYAPTVADYATSMGGIGPPGPMPIPIHSFTPQYDGEIEVTISAEAVAQALDATPVGITAWLGGSNLLVKPGQPNPQDNRVTILSIPASDTAVGPFTVSGTFTVTAGTALSIVLWIGRAGKPSSVAGSGAVPKPVDTGAAVNVNIRGITPRITHVKA